ncbi:FAD-dependent oxidoreductase [Jonesia quinghaiensis]|uniref:FAD-dependent oxidoreductase n=1 Tax=Jonesia quinghaiensis TaxID=262806 RepID=UPI00040511DF|nr:FAD-dependent oxidoreductase [Jonesia quinghaiensis]
MTTHWDVLIIGGGAAGLSAALTLTRARRNVLIIDANTPRNRFTNHMHELIGRDHTSPADLYADARTEISGYGGQFLNASATSVRKTSTGFTVTTTIDTHHTATHILVTTGLTDVLPDLTGLPETWGQGAAVCPYCDAYEVRDQPIGVLATGPNSIHQAQLLRQWSPNIIYLSDAVGPPTGEDRTAFDARGIRIVEGPIDHVTIDGGTLNGVTMRDGQHIALAALFLIPTLAFNDTILTTLGTATTDTPMGTLVTVDATGATSTPGLWAAGNVVNPAANVPMSIGAGAATGGAINHALIQRDIAEALAGMA